MKRTLSFFLALVTLFTLVACGKEKSCEHYFESETIKEATYQENGEIKSTCILCDYETREIIPQLFEPVRLSILAIDTFEQKRDPLIMPDGFEIFQPSIYWIRFDLDVENMSDKDITEFSGTIAIVDGERHLNVSCKFNETITAGETIHLSNYGFQISTTDLTLADNMLMGKSIDDIQIDFTLGDVKYK